jgi:hypothetical protein
MIKHLRVWTVVLVVALGSTSVLADGGSAEAGVNILPSFSIGASLSYSTTVAPDLTLSGGVSARIPLGAGSPSVALGAGLAYAIPIASGEGLFVAASVGPRLDVDVLPSVVVKISLLASIYAGLDVDPTATIYGGAYVQPGLELAANNNFNLNFVLPNGLYAGVLWRPFNPFSLRANFELNFGSGIGIAAKLTALYGLSSNFSVGATGGLEGNLSFNTLGPVLRVFAVFSF